MDKNIGVTCTTVLPERGDQYCLTAGPERDSVVVFSNKTVCACVWVLCAATENTLHYAKY